MNHTSRPCIHQRTNLSTAMQRIALAGAFGLVTTLAVTAHAADLSYSLSFSDKSTGAIGSGSFVWNPDTEIMSGLHWSFADKAGAVIDSALAATYHSYDPLAGTYGELFYRYLTSPQAYLIAQYGQLSSSVGLMPSNVTGDFGFIAFGAEKTSAIGTYRFLNTDWSLVGEGYVAANIAASVPESSSAAMLLAGLGLLGGIMRRRVGA